MTTTLSDARFKENIDDIQDIATLLSLVPVEYTLKGGSKLQYGFLAQDLESTNYKHIVYQNGQGVRSIAYTQIVPILVKHIQLLTNRIAALESERNHRNL